MNNPLVDFASHPNFADAAPAQVGDAIDQSLAAARRAVAAVANGADGAAADGAAEVSWEAVMAPLEEMSEGVMRVWNQVDHMHSVMLDDQWAAAHGENIGKIAAFFSEVGQNRRLYERARALVESPQFAGLSAVRRKITQDALRDFELSGVALPPAEQKEFCDNSKKLAALGAKFEENLVKATNAFSVTVDDEATLGDMPADLRDIARRAADGKFVFTLHAPSYTAFMQYAQDRELRQKMYRAYSTRASDLGDSALDNTPLIADILRLRRRQAALLGFGQYADLALQSRMAQSPDAVMKFLRELAARAKPFAEREMRELREFAAAELGIADLQAWDVPFASERLRRHQFDFSDADLRPYLREDKILPGLFACIERVFGARLREAAAEDYPPLWQEDARYMEVCDLDGTVIGGLYLDLYARKSKRGGAWMGDALSRFRRGDGGDGGAQLPLAHIVCNFAKPAEGGVALLNWSEAVTLFHEAGHALHHLLTEVEEFSASGISGVEWDAVELPSQLVENFIWDWRVLQPMTAHFESGEAMPRALFDKAVGGRRFQSGLFLMRQLGFALFDFLLHSEAADGEDAAVARAVAAALSETAVMPLPEFNRFWSGFSHIFGGGYAAGYYSYLWAEVLAADMLTMFEDGGGAVTEAGRKFRREVLAVGGSRPAMESFVAARGRAPDMAPLLRRYGLV